MSARGREFWVDFFKQFERSDLTLIEFCKRSGVAYKTARNWSSRLNGEAQSGQGHSGQGHKATKEEGESAGNTDDTGTADQKNSPPPPGKPASPAGGEEQGGEKAWNAGWANLIPAEKGNQRALKHGAYANALPQDIADHLNTYGRENIRSLEEEIKLTKGRLMMVTQKRAEWDARDEYNQITRDDYDLAEVTVKVSSMGEASGTETTEKRVRPDFDLQEDRLTRRLAWLQQVHDQLSRRISLTADEAVAKRCEIMERAEAEGWSAADTGMEIEKYGLELPFTLQQRIRAELALIEPPEPEGGMTDDELEALSAEYDQERASEDQWLEQRRVDVEAIHKSKEAERKGE